MTTRDALIEAMARVVADGFYFGMPQVDPDAVPDGLAKDIALAALAAIEAAGVRLVNFTALAEDDAAVDAVEQAIVSKAHIALRTGEGPGLSILSDIGNSREVALAAIRAMGGLTCPAS